MIQSLSVVTHFVYTRWDRWTACGLSKASFTSTYGTRQRHTTGVVARVTCIDCQRVVGA